MGSPAEQEATLLEQARQRDLLAAKREQEKAENAQAAAEMEELRRLGSYQDAKVSSIRAEMRKKLMEENKSLASQQYSHKSFLESNVFKNAIDSSFFDQFGTTSR